MTSARSSRCLLRSALTNNTLRRIVIFSGIAEVVVSFLFQEGWFTGTVRGADRAPGCFHVAMQDGGRGQVLELTEERRQAGHWMHGGAGSGSGSGSGRSAMKIGPVTSVVFFNKQTYQSYQS